MGLTKARNMATYRPIMSESRMTTGPALFEGDIRLTIDDYDILHELSSSDQRRGQGDFTGDDLEGKGRPRNRRAVTAFKDRIWPNATIPYVIGDRVAGFVSDNIRKAMDHWEKHTCIRFTNRSEFDQDYINFDPGLCGCCSFVGRKGGRQEVTLSAHCAAYGVVIHELGHVIGFWHEHSRPDRDKYIKIVEHNIIPEKMDNFDIKSAGEIDSLGQPYDYYSIMHYRRKTFSRLGKITMEPRERGVQIGQRDALSPGDRMQANLLYNCPKPECGEEIIGGSGNISSPNYPVKYYRDHTCIWVMHVRPEEEITVEFVDVAIESSANCSYDYLEIREGVDATGLLIGRLCGEGKGGQLKSTKSEPSYLSGSGEVSSSSGSMPSGGSEDYIMEPLDQPSTQFLAKCTKQVTDRKGEITSPLLLAQYNGDPIDCSWTIAGGSSAIRVHLAIRVTSLKDSPEVCVGDIYQMVKQSVRHKNLKVPHRQEENDALKAEEHSGSDLEEDGEEQDVIQMYEVEKFLPVRYNCQQTKQLTLDTQKVMIQWSSDINRPFVLDYVIACLQLDYDECAMGSAACEHVCHNTLQGYSCSCRRGYSPHPLFLYRCIAKKAQFADKCNSSMTSERGRLRASTEPIEDCEWNIQPPKGLRMFLNFDKFDIPSQIVNNTCTENYVEIFTGSSMNSRGRFCGALEPEAISTSSGLIVIRAHTDTTSVLTMPYFTASYTTFKNDQDGECSFRMRANGHVSSPLYPQPYPPHANCVWRVSAPKNSFIRVHIEDVDIETTKGCDFDYVEFREGRHRTSPLLAKLCGNRTPQDIDSKGRHLWVNFLSDKDGSGRGFRATFSSVQRANRTATENETESKEIETETIENVTTSKLESESFEISSTQSILSDSPP
ncbi:hypothetical protein CAPTEDRAFT_224057 [Capitella teleta]|uniref:Metalloendopeptidase n=1 Tax=Capitella teleta TaxID=283909 RepID=R7T4S7_CAPTE|nr:hypothetical protein CAPTEDRAFT_224057 [Capitella teleta]|eukprot:ELT87968.1 hypothetical protein CAPTEDRAFT_224057 [Capitella teleta]